MDNISVKTDSVSVETDKVTVTTNTPNTTTPTTSKVKMEEVISNLSEDDLKDVAINRLQWENRRKITWVFTYGFIAYVFCILCVLVVGSKEMVASITMATDLLTWIIMGMLSIPTLYFGGTVLEKFTGINKKTN